jgi:hypothetical protein
MNLAGSGVWSTNIGTYTVPDTSQQESNTVYCLRVLQTTGNGTQLTNDINLMGGWFKASR